jgi:hypothetical protein
LAPNDLGWEIITPNHLKLGRNNFRQLEGKIQLSGGPQTMLERKCRLTEKRYQLFVDRIPLLAPKAQKDAHTIRQFTICQHDISSTKQIANLQFAN